jgi:hypothetical protein
VIAACGGFDLSYLGTNLIVRGAVLLNFSLETNDCELRMDDRLLDTGKTRAKRVVLRGEIVQLFRMAIEDGEQAIRVLLDLLVEFAARIAGFGEKRVKGLVSFLVHR